MNSVRMTSPVNRMAAGGGASTGVFLAMIDLHPALRVHRRIVVIDIVSQQ